MMARLAQCEADRAQLMDRLEKALSMAEKSKSSENEFNELKSDFINSEIKLKSQFHQINDLNSQIQKLTEEVNVKGNRSTRLG